MCFVVARHYRVHVDPYESSRYSRLPSAQVDRRQKQGQARESELN